MLASHKPQVPHAQVYSTELAGFRRPGCRLLRRVLPSTEEEARRIWAFCPVAEGA